MGRQRPPQNDRSTISLLRPNNEYANYTPDFDLNQHQRRDSQYDLGHVNLILPQTKL